MEQRTEHVSLKLCHAAELKGGTDFNGSIGTAIVFFFHITTKKSLEKQTNCSSKAVTVAID